MRGVLLIFCMFAIPFGFAKDYGVLGKTYPIAEMDFLEYIQQKMKALEASGELRRLQSEFKTRVKAHVFRPEPNTLPRAHEDRQWLFNPEFVAPFDVRDSLGVLIVAKGTKINPLERVGLSSTLLFFDGDDKDEVVWAMSEKQRHTKIKLILTSGSVKDTANYFKEAVYFDLNGFLIHKFQIKALPATVSQKGLRLEVSEVRI